MSKECINREGTENVGADKSHAQIHFELETKFCMKFNPFRKALLILLRGD